MKNYKIISILLGLVLAAGVGGYVYWKKNAAYDLPPVPGHENADTAVFTASEVANHATRESCWSSINGNVYDLTSWIPKHPGGEKAILGICGIDGSDKYNKKHGVSQKQAMILSGFRIGKLSE